MCSRLSVVSGAYLSCTVLWGITDGDHSSGGGYVVEAIWHYLSILPTYGAALALRNKCCIMRIMKAKTISLVIGSLLCILLGGLWFLQGIDVVRIKPIACVANCQETTGGSLPWAIVGVCVLSLGIFLGYKAVRK